MVEGHNRAAVAGPSILNPQPITNVIQGLQFGGLRGAPSSLHGGKRESDGQTEEEMNGWAKSIDEFRRQELCPERTHWEMLSGCDPSECHPSDVSCSFLSG